MQPLTTLLAGIAVASGAAAQTFSLQIEASPPQSSFHIGEVIRLKSVLEMTSSPSLAPAGPPGWMIAVLGHERSVLGIGRDRFVVTPEVGTRDPWNYRLHQPMAYSGPGGVQLGGKLVVLDIDLNQWIRFEHPGHYAVHALFHVMGPQGQDAPVESNPIEIDVTKADTQWAEQELASDIAILKSTLAKIDSQSIEARMNAARRIAYLDSPAAIREMARWLGMADTQTAQLMADGLQSSRHAPEAVSAMKELLRSAAEPLPPIFLRTLAALDKTDEPQHALMAVVEQKQGAAKAISLKTVIEDMPPGSVSSELRYEMAAAFPDLPDMQQSELLNDEWNKIGGPEMIPVLREIYDKAPQSRYPENPLLASAVERLFELDPNRIRELLLEEIKRPEPRLPYHTLAQLPDATLPELDATLLDHLRHDGGHPVEELIARYASGSIVGPVMDFFNKRDAEMRSRVTRNPNIAAPACEPPLVAYFLRVEPAWGEKSVSPVAR